MDFYCKTYNMINRICQLNNELDGSVFLFGARQTGKSTFLEAQFPDAVYIDLLDAKLRRRFSAKRSKRSRWCAI